MGSIRQFSAAAQAGMRHIADAELKTFRPAWRIDHHWYPLPQFGVQAQGAAVKDDASHPHRRGAGRCFGRRQRWTSGDAKSSSEPDREERDRPLAGIC